MPGGGTGWFGTPAFAEADRSSMLVGSVVGGGIGTVASAGGIGCGTGAGAGWPETGAPGGGAPSPSSTGMPGEESARAVPGRIPLIATSDCPGNRQGRV